MGGAAITALATIAGAIVGAVLTGPVTYGFSKRLLEQSRSHNLEALRITDFNKGAAAFRAAFVNTIFLLRRHKEGSESLVTKIITDRVIVNQEKAKIRFEPFLDKTALHDFSIAWDAYVNCRANYGTINTNPTKAEESQSFLDHIYTLLNFAVRR